MESVIILAIIGVAIYWYISSDRKRNSFGKKSNTVIADQNSFPQKELKTIFNVPKENWQNEAFIGNLPKAPMVEFEGIVLYYPSLENETKTTSHSYETGSYSINSFGTISPQTGSYSTTERNSYLKFLWLNSTNSPIDICLRCSTHEETIRNEDGTFNRLYKDTPEAESQNLPAGELGKITLKLNRKGPNYKTKTVNEYEKLIGFRPLVLESVFVKPHGSPTEAWMEHKISVNIANASIWE